jgi:hypothetical protein
MWRQVAVVVAVALLAGGSAQGAGKAGPANTSPPTISGTERGGETLTASSGTWSGSTPMNFSYRWQRCNKNGGSCDNINGARNQTYVLQPGDVGRRIRVSVTASNSEGSANATSAATGIIANGLSPQNTAVPVISGNARAGSTLSTTNGTWTNSPTSFDYQWRRCNTAGSNCHDVGPNRASYTVSTDDIGSTIRVQVRARNPYGATEAHSNPTAVVVASPNVPANTAAPVISGLPRNGQLLVASTGTWTNNPSRYAFQWFRCDSGGNNCNAFGGAGQSQRLGSTEVGHTIRVSVTAFNNAGSARATSAQTAVVAGAGATAIPVSQVSLPNQLVIANVQFVPSHLSSRASFLARFRITDSSGHLVQGALVYGIGIPYGWVRNAPEAVTGGDGWATIQFFPTRLMPLHRAALVMFVRARKPGESLLRGVAARRLVQVRIG